MLLKLLIKLNESAVQLRTRDGDTSSSFLIVHNHFCLCVCVSFQMEFKVIFKFSVEHCIMHILNIEAKITIKCFQNGFMDTQKRLSTIIKLSSSRDPG